MLISSTKKAQSRVVQGNELGKDLCSSGELTGNMESQEIGGEIIRPLDLCHSGRHQIWVAVGHFGVGSVYLMRKPGMLREHSVQVLSTTGWCAVHTGTTGQGRIRQI